MASEDQDVDDFVQSFVQGDLASLDHAGDKTNHLEFSGQYLEKPSPKPESDARKAPVMGPRASSVTQEPSKSPQPASAPAPEKAPKGPAATVEPQDSKVTASTGSTRSPVPSSPTSSRTPSGESKGPSFGKKFKSLGRRITSSSSHKKN